MDLGTLHCSGWRKNFAAGSRESYDPGYGSATPVVGWRLNRSRLSGVGGLYPELPACEDEMSEVAVSAEDEPAPEEIFFLADQECLSPDIIDDFGVFGEFGAAQSKTASRAATIKPAASEGSGDYSASNDDYSAPIDVRKPVFEPRKY